MISSINNSQVAIDITFDRHDESTTHSMSVYNMRRLLKTKTTVLGILVIVIINSKNVVFTHPQGQLNTAESLKYLCHTNSITISSSSLVRSLFDHKACPFVVEHMGQG
jgi:hypothetical protein